MKLFTLAVALIGGSLFSRDIGFNGASQTWISSNLMNKNPAPVFSNFYGLDQSPVPRVSAHRGASRVAPENTLVAFAKAIEMGADFIEIDVRTTSDGQQVCMHDESLKRTTGLDSDVKNVSYKKIKTLSAGEWFDAQYAGERVPSLEAVCQLVTRMNKSRNTMVNLYVDCKDIREGEVIRILNQYQLLDSAVFYGNVNTLQEIRKISPTARLMPAYPGRDQVERVNALHPFAYDVPWSKVDAALVMDCHKKGIKVFSDLLDENDVASQYRKAIRLGIDLIQTDDVSRVKDCIATYQKKQ